MWSFSELQIMEVGEGGQNWFQWTFLSQSPQKSSSVPPQSNVRWMRTKNFRSKEDFFEYTSEVDIFYILRWGQFCQHFAHNTECDINLD